MDNNKIMKFGYEDTDKKILIDLYGLKFEIKNITNENIEEMRNIDKNLSELEKEIEKILGAGSVSKINNKRLEDGHEEMTVDVEMAVLGCIFESYANATANNMFDKVTGTAKGINDKIENITNRQQRRNYNRRNYKSDYNRNYRRY